MLALPMLDAGIRLRPALPRDVPGLARVRIQSWRHAYRTILPREELDRMTLVANRAKFRRAVTNARRDEHALVAVRDERPVGYALGGLQPDHRLAFRGEIYELYVDPAEQRRGIGRALLARSIWTLIDRGMNPVMLWVLSQNSATHFYESCGGSLIARSRTMVGGQRYGRLGFGWRDALPLFTDL